MRYSWRLLVCALLAGGAQAQWMHYPTPGIPRGRDGKANLTAPAPRMNGKPDLSGLWQVEPTPSAEMARLYGPGLNTFNVPGDDLTTFHKYGISILADFKPEEAPMTPAAAEIAKLHFANPGTNPTSHCQMAGLPFGQILPFANKFIQTPGLIVVMQEADGAVRQIFTDGRKHTADAEPTWMGYSVGRWEGDALVVDTRGFNDKAWLDGSGHPRSEAMHLTERYRRRDFGHMDVEVTFDDPKMYTKIFSIKYTLALLADSEVGEYVCAENEKDSAHIK